MTNRPFQAGRVQYIEPIVDRDGPISVPFAAPDIGEDEISAVIECLRSGWLTTGNRALTFERDFAAFLGGSAHAVAVSSCTTGLQIALMALGIKHGDEVITSDFTFSASAMCAVHIGAKPVLVDIDPATLNIDCQKLEDAITPRTKAIIPVHYAGLACDMESINNIARRHNLRVIEDAAHAFPSTWNGTMIGCSTADATVFSFYATKTITTGEGGMITFGDPDIARYAKALRLHGIDRDVFARYQTPNATWRYDIVAPGIKGNMMDLVAAIGIVQLKRTWKFHKKRTELASGYDQALAGLPLILPPKAPPGQIQSNHLYPIRLRNDSPVDRDNFIARMGALGVNCGVHFIPLHLHSFWREALGISEETYPEAQKAFECIITLPLFSRMTDKMQDHVVNAVKTLLS